MLGAVFGTSPASKRWFEWTKKQKDSWLQQERWRQSAAWEAVQYNKGNQNFDFHKWPKVIITFVLIIY